MGVSRIAASREAAGMRCACAGSSPAASADWREPAACDGVERRKAD
jgi:hypothetical protein